MRKWIAGICVGLGIVLGVTAFLLARQHAERNARAAMARTQAEADARAAKAASIMTQLTKDAAKVAGHAGRFKHVLEECQRAGDLVPIAPPSEEASPTPSEAAPEPASVDRSANAEIPEGMLSREELERMRDGGKNTRKARSGALAEPRTPPRSTVADPARAFKKMVAELTEVAEHGQALAVEAPEIVSKARLVEASIGEAPTRKKAEARTLELESFAARMKGILVGIDELLPRFLELSAQLEAITTEATRAREEARAALLRREQEEAQRALIAADLARLENLRTQNRDRLLRHDYAAMADLFAECGADCSSDEGRFACLVAEERARKLAWLRGYIIGKLQAEPMRWGWGSGNTAVDILGADEQGVRIRGRDVPWSGVSVPQFATWTVIYSKAAGLPPRTSADLLLALAVFYAEHGAEEKAAKARELALTASADVREEADRLLPQE